MKQKKEKKLHLGKVTIQNLDTVLAQDDQKRIKGGGTTKLPIYCKPTP